MERLKQLQSFSWQAVDKHAATIADMIQQAQKEGRTSVEYMGALHDTVRVILDTNGFRTSQINVAPPQYCIKWSPFVESHSDGDGDRCGCGEACPCDSAAAADAEADAETEAQSDDFKRLLLAILSSSLKAAK